MGKYIFGPVYVNPESTDRTKKELVEKTPYKVPKGMDRKGLRKRVRGGLCLSKKLREVGEMDVLPGIGDNLRKGLEFTDLLGSSQSNEKEGFSCKVMKRSRK